MANDTASTTTQAQTGMVMPTSAELAKAREAATKPHFGEDDGTKPGRVLDMDYSKFAVAIVDLAETPDRVEHNRRRHASKGYAKVGGSPIVMGFPKAEVWVISREDYERNRANRYNRLVAAVDAGILSETAIAVETVVVPRRRQV